MMLSVNFGTTLVMSVAEPSLAWLCNTLTNFWLSLLKIKIILHKAVIDKYRSM